jgi:hypothetical protein
MKAQYIKHKKQWSAFMTLNGLDIQEYGDTEAEARQKLADRISNSKFLMEGIKLPK